MIIFFTFPGQVILSSSIVDYVLGPTSRAYLEYTKNEELLFLGIVKLYTITADHAVKNSMKKWLTILFLQEQ